MAEQTQFKYLFTPLKIGPITLRNRISTTAHGTGYLDPIPELGYPGGPGHHGERYAYYLAERIKGGAAMVFFGGTVMHITTAYEVHHIEAVAWDKAAVPGMKLAIEMVHAAGGKIILQILHSGGHNTGRLSKLPAWAPSTVSGLGGVVDRELPKTMEKEEIQELIDYHALCAENAVEAGFDGVELHGATSYIFHQFHSPVWNKRTDEYGGSFENRMRFTMEVIDRVKPILGKNMVLGFRLSADDFVPAGLGINELKQIGAALEATGKIDYLNIGGSLHGGLAGMTMYDPHCTLVPYAAALKEVVSIPVLSATRIVDPVEGEKILADGHADIIGMTRAQIADPELANKAREGRLDEIRHCVGCNQLCLGNALLGLPVDCTQNPAAGREKEWGAGTLKQAEKKKKVMVIGGGPGGMEAAWVAAARGHDVTLYEKKQELGGQINLAAKLPGRAESDEWSRWRKVMVAKYGVKVVLGKEITFEDVLKEDPDAVVVATGSRPQRDGLQGITGEPIPGWDSPNVLMVDEVLEGKEVPTQKVIIFDEEAHIKGAGVADLLATQGKQVEMVGRHANVGNDVDMMTLPRVEQIISQRGVKVSPFTFIAKIEKDRVSILNVHTHAVRVEEGPVTVIMNTGRQPNEDLYFALKGKVKELHRLGDCVAPRLVSAAIYDGHKLGREL